VRSSSSSSRRGGWPSIALTALLALPACTSGKHPSDIAPPGTAVVGPSALPVVDQIRPAVAALEARLGGPQQYFEINATAHLVNLFVALNDGTVAQPWVYLDGELSSKEGQPAQGHSFAASALTFDAARILAPTRARLPDSAIDLLVVEGGEGGTVRYTLHATSTGQGQLLVTVGPDGAVQAVESG
jgi:hypothetical protein